jgi:hypothetical protein
MLHLGFLRIAGQTKPALAVRFSERSLSGCISKPADCFRLMRQAETKYDPQLLQELHRAEEALKAVYAETEP